ncbi:PREDICTED: uncharacterized protein LOC109462017 [Branchiostoma belcheri]|uniref:Uncharacterized protein LOC109462017 n=1 Tax=Branchiostoma belcheri TaxID=7741 RepID=A0A6P4YB66_BRABE|nr:PREDICTED: uncharacterized protein LOC109462017 [Branchiostoma belcheri]
MQHLYSQACRQGEQPVHSVRGLVVGQFRSGKTCVVRRLTGEKAVEQQPVTDGIEISPSVMTKTWRTAREEPDEFKETMAERLAEQQERAESSPRTMHMECDSGETEDQKREHNLQTQQEEPLKTETPKQDSGETEDQQREHNLQTQQKEPPKSEAPTQRSQSFDPVDENRGEDMNRPTSPQKQPQEQIMGDVTVQHQAKGVANDGITNAAMRRQGATTVRKQTYYIPNDVVIKTQQRIQGGVTEEQLGTAEHPRISFWDFGGQATYYGSHQCFFTYRGIYILVMSLLQKLSDRVPDLDYKASADNLETGRDYLDHWLNSVRTHTLQPGQEETGKPPIVLVLTHKDKVSELEIERYKKDILDHIGGKAAGKHVLPEIFVIDNFSENDGDFDELREYIRKEAKGLWFMGEKVPMTWLHLKSKLIDKRTSGDPFCRFQDVVDLARSDDVGIADVSDVADILTFLHALGDIIFINEPVLGDHVVLRPQVMIDVFKTIITVPEYQQDRSTDGEVAEMWRRLETEGILSDRFLTIIWTNADQKMQKPFLLRHKLFLKRLMEKYYLLCNATPIGEFADTAEEPEKEEIYFVPSLLAAKPDDNTLYPGHMRRHRHPLYVKFENMFLPSGMFYRLQAICVRRFGLEESHVFSGCGRFPTDDVQQQFVVTKVKHYLKVELLSAEDKDQPVFTQGLPVRKFLSSCLFEIKEKWIPSIQYDWCFGEASDEEIGTPLFHTLSDTKQETATGSSRFPENFVDVWMGGSGDNRTSFPENLGGSGPMMIEPTQTEDTVRTIARIGPVLDCMETCEGLSLTECDRIRRELTFISRFKKLVDTVKSAGDMCHRLLGASVEVCLPEKAPMFLRQKRGNEIVILHVGDYNDKLIQPLLGQVVKSSNRYGVTVSEDVIKPGNIITVKSLDHLLQRNVRMVVPIITPQALHSRYWSSLGYEFCVQNKNLVCPVLAYPEGTRERLLEVLGRRCAGMLDMPSTEVPMTEEPLSRTKISLTAAEILNKASTSVVLNTYRITTEGCTLEEDGVTISFPEGCVETERLLSLEVEMLPIDDALTETFSAVTPVLTVHQEKEEDFLEPVSVTLPWAWKKIDCSADQTVLMERKSQPPRWTLLQAEFQETEDELTFTTRHFCGMAGAKESGNGGESSTSTPGNQDESANQEAAEESFSRDQAHEGETANQKTADKTISREPGNKNEATTQEAENDSISREPRNQNEAANQKAVKETFSKEPANESDVANQTASGQSMSGELKVSSASKTTVVTEQFQACCNRCTGDKVYLIVNPNQATTDKNYIHLLCVHKDDDAKDFFRADNMRWPPPFQQRIVMGEEEKIDAEFDNSKDVIADLSKVLEHGHTFYFPPADCNRWSVGLILNATRPGKKNYEGTVNFTRRLLGSGKQIDDVRRQISPATVFFYHDKDVVETSEVQEKDTTVMSKSVQAQFQPKKAVVSVLMVNDKYGTSHGGTSTTSCQVAQFLQRHGAIVHCTAVQASEEDKRRAAEDGVRLHLPVKKHRDKRTPSLEWLTHYHSIHFPDIPQDLNCIVGNADVTSEAAKSIRENGREVAKLVIFNHDMPEDTEHYKGAGRKVEDILDDTKNADAVFSLGRRIYDYFETKYNSLGESRPRKHFLFRPRPSPVFEAISVRPGGGEKVVLFVGTVTGVEKLKGHDLVARALGEVAEKIPNVRLRVRVVDEDDYEASKKILQENLRSSKIKPTLLPCGTQEDIAQDMQQAHLVLMPSRAEPFGLIGLEAITAGIPVLISDKSGLADMIKDLIKEKKCNPDMRHRIVETSMRETDLDEDAREWAKKIADTLECCDWEFQKAEEFKKTLLDSKYWEESHQNLLRVCGLID